jgi:PAS domain S-box-containing protein
MEHIVQNDEDKPKAAIIAELEALKKEVARLQSTKSISRDERLKLAILRRLPFTIWACDRNFHIVLWSGKCEEIYGYTAERAIGTNYVDLFVDPPEKEQSKADCLKIIDNDMVQKNFLAYDQASDGSRRTMLTNCFRIRDEENGEYLQAEVALEISDLELRKEDLRKLREVGQHILALTARNVDLERRQLSLRIDLAHTNKLESIKQREMGLNKWFDDIRRTANHAKAQDMTTKYYEELKEKRQELVSRCQELRTRVEGAVNLDELGKLFEEVAAFEAEQLFDEHVSGKM